MIHDNGTLIFIFWWMRDSQQHFCMSEIFWELIWITFVSCAQSFINEKSFQETDSFLILNHITIHCRWRQHSSIGSKQWWEKQRIMNLMHEFCNLTCLGPLLFHFWGSCAFHSQAVSDEKNMCECCGEKRVEKKRRHSHLWSESEKFYLNLHTTRFLLRLHPWTLIGFLLTESCFLFGPHYLH